MTDIILKNGDVLDELSLIENSYFDMAVIDPPYILNKTTGGISKTGLVDRWQGNIKGSDRKASIQNDIKFEEWLPEVYRVMKDNSHCYIWTNDKNLSDLQSTTSTSFTQTESNFEMKFNEIISKMNENANETSEEFKKIVKYIRFDNGNIILGEEGNQLILKIQNDRISYQQNGSEVAYFSNNKLYVTTLEVTHSFQIGNFIFIPRENGNLSFKKVGGN